MSERKMKRTVVSSFIVSIEFLQTVKLINVKFRLLRDIDSTTVLAMNMTKIMIKNMFKMNLRVFGVASLFTC